MYCIIFLSFMWEKKDDADPNNLLKNKKKLPYFKSEFYFLIDVLIAQCSLRNRGDPSKGHA